MLIKMFEVRSTISFSNYLGPTQTHTMSYSLCHVMQYQCTYDDAVPFFHQILESNSSKITHIQSPSVHMYILYMKDDRRVTLSFLYHIWYYIPVPHECSASIIQHIQMGKISRNVQNCQDLRLRSELRQVRPVSLRQPTAAPSSWIKSTEDLYPSGQKGNLKMESLNLTVDQFVPKISCTTRNNPLLSVPSLD